mmetsp:Transcript_84544/g.244386  ORF Transcript_84544/g.244386 Transcript_84544/m.244386 type:complete len:789 (+) Transcript_84544:3-2369(+)
MASRAIESLVDVDCSDEEGALFVDRANAQSCSSEAVRLSRKYLAGFGVAAVAATLLIAGTARHSRPGVPDRTELAADEFVTLDARDDRCHTAVRGELCWKDVHWAMTSGIREHPQWYAGPCPHLQASSSFEEFQACVYKINMTSCPLPCNPSGGISDAMVAQTHRQADIHSKSHIDPCHIAKEGEDCFDDVVDAMVRGIIKHPHKFPGLTPDSTFEEFQQALYMDPDSSSCPRPCSCKTALPGDECYKHVLWAKNQGIVGHPDWYHGLGKNPTLEEIQAYLAKDSKGTCTAPCTKVDVTRARNGVGEMMGLKGKGSACFTDNWPDVKNKLVCGKCKVLVDKFDSIYKTCDRYCASLGRKCTGAWMDYDNTCSVLYPMECGESLQSDDAICECGKQAAASIEADLLKQTTTTEKPTEPIAETPEEEHDLMEQNRPSSEFDGCHTAVKGDVCYDDITFAMQKGVREHPTWYDGLAPYSTLEEFQEVLHSNPELNCPRPCPCKTARYDGHCAENVKWVLREGIPKHPSWYQGLTVRSRFEEVQQRLHEDQNTTCGKPCSMSKWNTPSLFCIAVFRSKGYEAELIHEQMKAGLGVFACDDFALLADKKLKLAPNIETLLIPPNEKVGVSKDGTAANTLIFMKAWLVVWYDVRWQAHDWIIKADPDAVLLPDRLRAHLKPHTGKNVFVKNCMKYSGPGWPMMFGSVEAFSNEALATYMKGADRCRTQLQWQAWGEDLFMMNCISMLGGGSVFDGGLVGDGVCKGANCADGAVAAFHPFKSVEKWFRCYHEAMR